MKKILFVLAIVLCCWIFTSCSTYACFQVKLNGGTALTPKTITETRQTESVIVDKWYYTDSTKTTYVVLQLEDSAKMTYSIVSPMFNANVGDKFVYEKTEFIGFENSPITNVKLVDIMVGTYYSNIQLIGDVVNDYGDVKNKKIYVDIPNKYLNWFRSRIYLSLYDLDLLKPNITYKIAN